VCKPCIEEADRVASRLAELFAGRETLIEMSQTKFDALPDNMRAYIAARDFDPDTENLFLYGDIGAGKTMIAAKIARQAVINRRSCVFEVVSEWLRSMYGAGGLEQQAAINRLASARVLVLDEIGAEPETPFSKRALYDVINSRWLGRRNGLVATSNLSLEQLGERINDDRILSRLSGLFGRNVYEIIGPDRRQPEGD
jgi:DNA replication protein DnaC